MLRKRVYLAGPMTGYPDYNRPAFLQAAERIATHTNLIPVHTAWVNLGFEYDEYMALSIEVLELCDYITLLEGWEDSEGARIERRHAKKKNIPIVDYDKLVDEFSSEQGRTKHNGFNETRERTSVSPI
jgi:hypothetical protein